MQSPPRGRETSVPDAILSKSAGKPVYTKVCMFDIERNKSGVQEWAEKSENIQRGCPNNCLYCYSAYTFNRFKLRKREEWGREELTKRADMRSYPVCEGVVMFPSSHDITDFNVEHFIRAARLMLEKGNRLLIVSKPRRECMAKVMDALEP